MDAGADAGLLSDPCQAFRRCGGDVEPLAGDHVFVTWVDDRTTASQDMYLNLAPWTGAFAAGDVRLNVPPAGATAAGYLDVTTYVVWIDDRDGNQVVYMDTARP